MPIKLDLIFEFECCVCVSVRESVCERECVRESLCVCDECERESVVCGCERVCVCV